MGSDDARSAAPSDRPQRGSGRGPMIPFPRAPRHELPGQACNPPEPVDSWQALKRPAGSRPRRSSAGGATPDGKPPADSDDDEEEEDDDFAKNVASSAPPEDPRVTAAPPRYCMSVTALSLDSVEVSLFRSLSTVETAEQRLGGGEHGVVPGGGGDVRSLELMRAMLSGIVARVRKVKDVGTTTAMTMSSIEVTAGKAGIGTDINAPTRPLIFGIADPDGEDPPVCGGGGDLTSDCDEPCRCLCGSLTSYPRLPPHPRLTGRRKSSTGCSAVQLRILAISTSG